MRNSHLSNKDLIEHKYPQAEILFSFFSHKKSKMNYVNIFFGGKGIKKMFIIGTECIVVFSTDDVFVPFKQTLVFNVFFLLIQVSSMTL